MYPEQDLIRIAGHKAALRHNISLNRARILDATARVSKPVALVDRAWAFWKDLSPIVQIAAVPVGVAATRALFPRLRILRKLVRWSPLVIAAMRAVNSGVGRGQQSRRP
jgi:hypothetical protein